MKKLILLMSLVAVAIGFAGCNNDDPTERQREAIANQSLIGHWCTTKIQYNEGGKWYEVTERDREHSCYLKFQDDKNDLVPPVPHNTLRLELPALEQALGSSPTWRLSWEADGKKIMLYRWCTDEKHDTEMTFEFVDIDKAVFKFPYEGSYATVHMTRLTDMKNSDMALNNQQGEGAYKHNASSWQATLPTFNGQGEVHKLTKYTMKFSEYELYAMDIRYRVAADYELNDPLYYIEEIDYNGKTYKCIMETSFTLTDSYYYYTFDDNVLTVTPRTFADFHSYPAKCENDKLTISVDGVDYVFNKVPNKSE